MAGFDKAGKDTGPGEGGYLIVKQQTNQKVVFDYILYNYNIDGNILKPEHKQLLDRDIIPFMKQHRVHAALTGTASQSGDREYNRQLSLGRILRVKKYLLEQGLKESQVPGPDIRAFGEDISTSKSNEDPFDRAVRLRITVGIKPYPIWPEIIVPIIITADGPRLIDPPPKSDPTPKKEKWLIRQIFGQSLSATFGFGGYGFSVGVGAGPIQYSFLIVNQKTRQMMQCTFGGAGISAGLGTSSGGIGQVKPGFGPGGGVSITGQSKTWDSFETDAGVGFNDFNGPTTWTEPAGAGLGTDFSVQGILHLPRAGTIRVTTGKTFGTPGAGTSLGNFNCGGPVVTVNPVK